MTAEPQPVPVSAPEPARAPVAPQPDSSTVEGIIRAAARKYGLNEDHFVAVAMCESSLIPSKVNYDYYENGHPSGLFQHISGYFPARAIKYGYSTDVFDAYSNANVTAAMWADGQSYLWQCK